MMLRQGDDRQEFPDWPGVGGWVVFSKPPPQELPISRHMQAGLVGSPKKVPECLDLDSGLSFGGPGFCHLDEFSVDRHICSGPQR
jgi:hypothetical protein